MADSQDKRDEKIGRAIATIIAGIVIFFLGKPLWIAPGTESGYIKRGLDEIINFKSEKR